ncbi:MAG TPA: hypothetical protein VND93_30400, partial [Myxococcales bacterium]|nr:hypothetical protein [Myxococcales bacterium]
ARERWQYLGTFFHPHLGAWVHDLRYRESDDGPQLTVRVPASGEHQPALGREDLERVAAQVRRLRSSRPLPDLEVVVSPVPGRAFAFTVPLAKGPAVWRCVRESLFPSREETVVLH